MLHNEYRLNNTDVKFTVPGAKLALEFLYSMLIMLWMLLFAKSCILESFSRKIPLLSK